MESPKSSNNETAGAVPKNRKANSKGKAPADAPSPPPVMVTAKATPPPQAKWKKGVAILDFIVRLGAIGATFAATSIMGTTDQQLPFFTQFLQFHAQYNNFSVFTGFVIATAAASGYLVLSLPFSIVCIVRPHATGPRLFLAIFDTVSSKAIISLRLRVYRGYR